MTANPTACLDWGRRLKRSETPISKSKLPMRTAEANRVAEFVGAFSQGPVVNQLNGYALRMR